MLNDFVIYSPMYVTLFWTIVFLFPKKSSNKAKSFLGVFMLLAFLLYLCHAAYFKGLKQQYLYFDSVYILAKLLVYPLYYSYIKLLTVDHVFSFKKNIYLYIPAGLFFILSISIYLLMNPTERMNYINYYMYGNTENIVKTNLIVIQHVIYLLVRIIFAIQIVYCLIKGTQLISKYNNRITNFYSNLEDKTIVWVKSLMFSLVLTSLLSIVFNIIGKHYFISYNLFLYIPSFLFTTLLFIIGFQGYMQNYSVVDYLKDEQQENNEYGLESDTKLKDLKNKLLVVFENEELYKNPNLKITDVSNKLKTNRTYISKIINTDFSQSFNLFVNTYRIKEAKKLLDDKNFDSYTMEYISEQVGFGSLHSFIRTFKKIEGTTPSNYKNKKHL